MIPELALEACHLNCKDGGNLYVASVMTGNIDIMIGGLLLSTTLRERSRTTGRLGGNGAVFDPVKDSRLCQR